MRKKLLICFTLIIGLFGCNQATEDITDIYSNKVLNYKKLSFEIGGYHLISVVSDESGATIKCERDAGYEDWQPQQISVSIYDFEANRFSNASAALEYLTSTYQDYNRINIFHSVADTSGITDMYYVSSEKSTLYIVFISEDAYAVESDSNTLQYDIFREWQTANIKVYRDDIPCGGGYTSKIMKTVFTDEQRVEYEVTQGKSSEKYTAFVELLQDGVVLTVKFGDTTPREFFGESMEYEYFADFLDLNLDGYMDMRLLEKSGTLNNSYALYIWNDSLNEYERVKCDELLSEIEVYDGYILNYQKNDAGSGIIQKLIWSDNALELESETPYETTSEPLIAD
jgi:hypothetical protein